VVTSVDLGGQGVDLPRQLPAQVFIHKVNSKW